MTKRIVIPKMTTPKLWCQHYEHDHVYATYSKQLGEEVSALVYPVSAAQYQLDIYMTEDPFDPAIIEHQIDDEDLHSVLKKADNYIRNWVNAQKRRKSKWIVKQLDNINKYGHWRNTIKRQVYHGDTPQDVIEKYFNKYYDQHLRYRIKFIEMPTNNPNMYRYIVSVIDRLCDATVWNLSFEVTALEYVTKE